MAGQNTVDPETKQGCNHTDRPRIAYLTTEYPHISHTFIRREIQGLEGLGYEIERFALQGGEADVEQADKVEAQKTTHLLGESWGQFFRQAFGGMLAAGKKLPAAMAEVFILSRASDRGLLRHVAYLFESLMFLTICRKRGVEHVHVHFGTNAATVAYLTNLMGGPRFSVMVHGPVEFDQPYGQSLGRKLAAASFVAAISNYCRSQIFRWLPHDHWHKVKIVPCTVGDEWFNAAQTLSEDAKDLVCVGRLDEQKGQLFLLEAFSEAAQKGFSGRLILIGDGPFKDQLKRRAAQLKISDRVELVGWCTSQQIMQYLLGARALVLASFAEGLPVVIMEAMALQRPILSTRITGIPELVRDGIDGFLYSPAEMTELAEAMLRLESSSLTELQEMGRNASQRVFERHLTEDAIQRLDQLLRDCA